MLQLNLSDILDHPIASPVELGRTPTDNALPPWSVPGAHSTFKRFEGLVDEGDIRCV